MDKHKRLNYTASFKLKVIKEAEKSNNSAVARKFGVNERQVREWRKNKDMLLKMPQKKKARRGGSVCFSKLEEALNSWILEKRKNGFIVTRTCIRLRALHLSKDLNIVPQPPTFVASAGWCTRFMKRYDLCLRQKTKISQRLPSDLEDKIVSWQKHMIRLRKKT